MSTTEESLPSNCWHFSYWYSSGWFWSLSHGCISGSCSVFFCMIICWFISTKLLSNWSDPSTCWWIGLFLLPRYSILHFFVKLEVIPVSSMLQLVEIFLKGITTHWYASHSSQFYILSTFPGCEFHPITMSILIMPFTTGYYRDPQLYFMLLILSEWHKIIS